MIKDCKKTRGGVRVDNLSILFHFKDQVLPNNVTIGYMSYVRAYVPKPLRCYKCQRLRHVVTACKEKNRCARCGEEHEYGKCGDGVNPKCPQLWGCSSCDQESRSIMSRSI